MYGENMYGEVGSSNMETGQMRNETGQSCIQPGMGPYTWTDYVNGTGTQTGGTGTISVRQYGPVLKKMMNHFEFYGIGCIVYGILFAICLYPGFCGISVPVLTIVTMIGLTRIFSDMEIRIRKETLFYFAAWMALSVSNCLTGSRLLVTLNTIGLLLLFLCFLLCHFCNTEGWNFEKYFFRICGAPFAGCGYWSCFFKSMKGYLSGKEKEKTSRGKYIWIGILVSVPILIVVLSLLASADAVFGHLLGKMLDLIRFPAHFIYMCLLLVMGSVGVYGLLAYFTEAGETEKGLAPQERNKWEPLIGITFLSILTAVYLIFSSIQIFYLFMHNSGLPEGYSYSSYAREGFFQLLFVCLINLVILLVCISWFREHKALKALLTVFCGCTFIMDASSVMRMILYVQACQLTFLRLFVLWALAVITVLLAGCVITIYKDRFPLFGYAMTAVTVCYLIFSLAKPDYVIAKYNLAHDNGDVDIYYLCSLSSDAVPAMEQAGVLGELYDLPHKLAKKMDRYETMGIRDFNFSDYRAGKILSRYGGNAEKRS